LVTTTFPGKPVELMDLSGLDGENVTLPTGNPTFLVMAEPVPMPFMPCRRSAISSKSVDQAGEAGSAYRPVGTGFSYLDIGLAVGAISAMRGDRPPLPSNLVKLGRSQFSETCCTTIHPPIDLIGSKHSACANNGPALLLAWSARERAKSL